MQKNKIQRFEKELPDVSTTFCFSKSGDVYKGWSSKGIWCSPWISVSILGGIPLPIDIQAHKCMDFNQIKEISTSRF